MTIGIDARLWSQTGVGRYIRNLVINFQEIDKRNNYVLFVRSEDLENLKSQISSPKFRIVKADIKWHSVSEQINFLKILEKENLELVHFPYFSIPVFYSKPFVITIHDLIMDHYPTGNASTLFLPIYYLKLIFYKFVIKIASLKAKKIIVPSNATRDEILSHLKVAKERIIVTHEAADEKISSVGNHQSVISQKYGEYFLYVGNAYPHKNLENLILGFKKFYSENPNTKLILAGKKDYFYEKIETFIKAQDLEQNVILFGKASDDELFNLYKNAKGLVSASLMEGFGLPVLEAMASKCLVICSDIPAFREVAGDFALYFKPHNVDEINDALKKASNNQYDTKMIEKAYNLSRNFSWRKTALETLRVYESSVS